MTHPTFDDLIPAPQADGLQDGTVNFDDLIPAPRADGLQGGLVNFDDLIPAPRADGLQGGLVNFDDLIPAPQADGLQGGLVSFDDLIPVPQADGLQGGLVNFDDLIPPSQADGPQGGLVNFGDLIPAPQVDGPQDGAVNFDDLIPNQRALWAPSSSGAGPVNFGQAVGNMIVAEAVHDSQPSSANGSGGASVGSGAAADSSLDGITINPTAPGTMKFARNLVQPDEDSYGGATAGAFGQQNTTPVGGQRTASNVSGGGGNGSSGVDVNVVSTPHVIANDGTDLGENDGVNEPGGFVALNYIGGIPSRSLWPAGTTALYGAIQFVRTGNRYFVFAGPDGSPQLYAVEYWTGTRQGAGGGVGISAGTRPPAASGGVGGGQPASAPVSAPDGGILDGIHGALAAASFIPEIGSISLGLDAGLSAGQALYDLANGNAGKAWGELGAAGLSAAAAGLGIIDTNAGVTKAAEQVAADGIKAAESTPITRPIGDLRAAGLRDAHHVIQDAAVRDLPGYDTNVAPGVHLEGPSTSPGTLHYNATQSQRVSGGGTYGAERAIAYDSLRAAGYSDEAATQALKEADEYFKSIGVTESTPTRIPGNRR